MCVLIKFLLFLLIFHDKSLHIDRHSFLHEIFVNQWRCDILESFYRNWTFWTKKCLRHWLNLNFCSDLVKIGKKILIADPFYVIFLQFFYYFSSYELLNLIFDANTYNYNCSVSVDLYEIKMRTKVFPTFFSIFCLTHWPTSWGLICV